MFTSVKRGGWEGGSIVWLRGSRGGDGGGIVIQILITTLTHYIGMRY